jgi:hypothetical protein
MSLSAGHLESPNDILSLEQLLFRRKQYQLVLKVGAKLREVVLELKKKKDTRSQLLVEMRELQDVCLKKRLINFNTKFINCAPLLGT